MTINKISRICVLLLLASLLCLASTAAAGIKEQMAARIPAISALKAKGVVGENNRGLLEFRSTQEQAAMVAKENADRLTVYAAIGQSQGVNPVLVGQRRATQIAEKGSKGEWFQRPDGSWYKK